MQPTPKGNAGSAPPAGNPKWGLTVHRGPKWGPWVATARCRAAAHVAKRSRTAPPLRAAGNAPADGKEQPPAAFTLRPVPSTRPSQMQPH